MASMKDLLLHNAVTTPLIRFGDLRIDSDIASLIVFIRVSSDSRALCSLDVMSVVLDGERLRIRGVLAGCGDMGFSGSVVMDSSRELPFPRRLGLFLLCVDMFQRFLKQEARSTTGTLGRKDVDLQVFWVDLLEN